MSMLSGSVGGKRILLVDDDRCVRETIREMLAIDGHIVAEANNGVEALGLFRQKPFDLVLIDFEIPFMKGDELAQSIRRLVPRQPILMISGQGRTRGPDNPVNAILHKPFDSARLRQTMADLVAEAEPETPSCN